MEHNHSVWKHEILKQHFDGLSDYLRNIKYLFKSRGGFAARAYGVQRELHDIDFDIPEADFEKILPEVRPYIIHGPTQYKDDHWDLILLTLSYGGQRIDISGAYDAKSLTKLHKLGFRLVSI